MNAPQASETFSRLVTSSVLSQYALPFELRDFQVEAIERLAPLQRSGWYADPGTGKTVMSTVAALFQQMQAGHPMPCFVIMPPILIKGWYRWLTEEVKGISKVVMYRGTPTARRELQKDLTNAQFILMSIQIFKKDLESLQRLFAATPRIGVIDEAHSVKNTSSDNYRMVRNFFSGFPLMLLTGTPLSNPGDAYAYIRLISPGIYKSKGQFDAIHVEERDYFGNVKKWRNLDTLRENLMCNSMRAVKEEVLKDLKAPNFIPIYYELEPAHKSLYRKLVDEQLILLEDGSKIDATAEARLYNMCQQIVVNWDHFSGNPKHRSAALDVVDAVIDELDLANQSENKLIIFSSYKMTNAKLLKYLQPYGAEACYSDIPSGRQEKNIDRFMNDPTCKVLVAHPLSAGQGLNPQAVCHDVLFLEEPVVPSQFHQAMSRVYRDGQKHTPNIRIAIAEGTIQVRLHRRLLDKDALVNKVQIGAKDLKDAIHGQ